MLARVFCAFLLLLTLVSAGAAPSFSVTFLPTNTFAYTINQSGHFAGEADFPPGVRHAALWNSLAAPRDLGTLGESSTAQAISTNGLVAGYSVLASGFIHGFVTTGGALADIGTLPGGANSVGYGVNASGTVVGEADDAAGTSHPVAYANGVLRNLGPPGLVYGQAHAINDAGTVAGFGQPAGSDDAHALLFSGGAATGTRGINNLGMVVGYSTYPDDVPGVSFSKATLYRDGVMLDLNTLVDTENGLWNFTDAVAINDAQQILVNACTVFGDCRTALLAPVPEPAALVLLLAGLLTIGAGRFAAPRSLLFT